MKRGEVWTVAGGKDYAGKPRPVVIVQDDRFDATDSITVCAFTTDPTEAALFRLKVEPTPQNGLRAACRLMVDKITTVPKSKLGNRIGRLENADMVRLNQVMMVFLGLALPENMMTRGIFDIVNNVPAYADAKKIWYISLMRSNCFWFDMIVNPTDSLPSDAFISSYLRELKEEVERILDRRFIYFFCSRPKVRFDINKYPHYQWFGRHLCVYVIFRKKRYKLKISLEKSERPEKFEISEKFIKFIYHNGNTNTYSVHDFLQIFGCDLGVPTSVHYVGATKNPHDRPINREHRGVADTLYNVSNDENDFFLIVSVFKVTSLTLGNNSGLSFWIGNSLSNEVPTDSEGRIIEGGFLSYFDSKIQKKERSSERPIFKNELINVKKENNIQYIVFDWEMEFPLEYYKLCSEKIKASDRHVFICKMVDDNVSIEPLDKGFDINRHLREEGNAG